VATTIEPGEHRRIEAIGFTPVAWLTGDERRGDDFAWKAIAGEHPLEDESGTRGFVTGSHGPSLGEAPEKAADLHEISRELDDLRNLGVLLEDRRGDRIEMHIETDPYILIHGWAPFEN
jgi:hypothetical protein